MYGREWNPDLPRIVVFHTRMDGRERNPDLPLIVGFHSLCGGPIKLSLLRKQESRGKDTGGS